jgi:outer membrane lipoprotein-sorting protein
MKQHLIHAAVRNDRKHPRAKQAFKRWALAACALAFSGALTAAPAPSANEILSQVRLQQSMQELDLQGQLRSDATVVPFRLTQTGPVIRYAFTKPDEMVQLRLGENGARLDLITQAGMEKLAAARLEQNIRGTGVTYADLALKFLYWPNAEVVGEESIRTRSCWKLKLTAPSRQAQYAAVLLWVDKESGALMRMEGYETGGQLTKRFEVVSAQKIEGRWFLKQMRIEQMQPGTGKVQSRTYLEIQKPG